MAQPSRPRPLKENSPTRSVPARKTLRRLGIGLAVILVLAGYWLLPISGQLLFVPGPDQSYQGVWPQVRVAPLAARPGDEVTLSLEDTSAWSGVKLYLNDTVEAALLSGPVQNNSGRYTWQWRYKVPAAAAYRAVFYHDCQRGCIEGASFTLGEGSSTTTNSQVNSNLKPTKLGLVFADERRDWHNRAGWDVELLYLRQPDNSDFGLDTLARKLPALQRQGLRVLVRLAYDRGQALPPAGDSAALNYLLEYTSRLARDQRLQGVYGYILGSGYNRKSENSLAADRPVTPEWYARIFNGYGQPPDDTANFVQAFRAFNNQARLLVGPVAPWTADQSGPVEDSSHAPWLNYMNSLVSYLDTGAKAKQRNGFTQISPDGFAVQASGRPEAVEVAANPSLEPVTDLYLPGAGAESAEMGFRVYRDWQRIINSFDSTRNLPVYITATNTFTSDTQIDPDQNYPVGWLTQALAEINAESQVQALCWFVDLPYDKWSSFSLQASLGSLKNAALEFDRLLQT